MSRPSAYPPSQPYCPPGRETCMFTSDFFFLGGGGWANCKPSLTNKFVKITACRVACSRCIADITGCMEDRRFSILTGALRNQGPAPRNFSINLLLGVSNRAFTWARPLGQLVSRMRPFFWDSITMLQSFRRGNPGAMEKAKGKGCLSDLWLVASNFNQQCQVGRSEGYSVARRSKHSAKAIQPGRSSQLCARES